MKTKMLMYAAIALLWAAATAGCNEAMNESSCNEVIYESQCSFSNPLTDLPWMKEWIDSFENGPPYGSDKINIITYDGYARIYQCSYRDGTGFILGTGSFRLHFYGSYGYLFILFTVKFCANKKKSASLWFPNP